MRIGLRSLPGFSFVPGVAVVGDLDVDWACLLAAIMAAALAVDGYSLLRTPAQALQQPTQ